MARIALKAAALFALALLLGGCYESPGVHVYEPGVYKGDRDPLLALQRSDQQQARLRERFAQVQMDR